MVYWEKNWSVNVQWSLTISARKRVCVGTKSKVGTLYNFKAGLDTKEEIMEMIITTTKRLENF